MVEVARGQRSNAGTKQRIKAPKSSMLIRDAHMNQAIINKKQGMCCGYMLPHSCQFVFTHSRACVHMCGLLCCCFFGMGVFA